jgi:Domain of unknown function (DUF4331)
MKTSSLVILASALALAFGATTACGGDDSGGGKSATGGGGTGATGGSGGVSGSGTGASGGTAGTGGGGNPTPPTLGKQIDRIGRPAINTALNHTFDPNDTTKEPAKDAYNGDLTPTNWANAYGAEFAANLAIFDGLDTVCGNQLGYSVSDAGGSPYATLAGVLANDWLMMDTTKTSCGYLGVEAPLVGLGTANCGGRPLDNDVMDASYSGLAAGTDGFVAGVPAVGDGIAANDVAFTQTFPYLAAPH